MKCGEILKEGKGIYAEKFADKLKESFFALRKKHLEFLLDNLDLMPNVSEVDFDDSAKKRIAQGINGGLADDFQYCGFTFKYKDANVTADLSISGFSIGCTVTLNGKRETTSQSQAFKTLVDNLEKAYKKLSK